MPYTNHRSQSLLRKGFTTIELLVVIAILLVLAAIVFVGVSHVGRSSKESATVVSLGNLQGMLADYENSSKLSKSPTSWLWTGGSGVAQTFPGPNGTISFDFWRGPSNSGTTTWTQDYALASPGAVAEDGAGFAGNQRHAAIAVTNTGLAMTLLAQFSDNRTRLNAIPQPQQFIPEWRSGQIALPGGGNANITYVPNARVKHLGKQWLASPTFPTNGNPTPGSGSAWTDITGRQQIAPILLDAWNNPIIFVPATGLRVRMLNGKTKYDSTDPTQTWIVISPEGEVSGNGTANPTILRPGRPFFASAGQDGDFNQGDDNIYSFEK